MILGLSAIMILALIFLGMSIPFCFLVGSLFYAFTTGTSVGTFVSTSYYSLDAYSLLALPLFMAAGMLIEKSGIAGALIDLAEIMLKKVKGGMGATIPVVACFFGALSGSGLATATTLSTMLGPKLEARGWDKNYIAAFIAASAPLGYMIPPNMNAIVYTKVSSASVAALFLATVIPGLLWAGSYLLINRIVYKHYYNPENAVKTESVLLAEGKEKAANYNFLVIKRVFPAFLMPVIILGGIYGGVFTATEAGGVACLYGLIVGVFIYKAFKIKDIGKVFEGTGYSLGTLLMIFPMTLIFTRLLVINGVPDLVTKFILGISDNKYIILIIIDVVLIIAGFFLDCNVLLLVFTPLLLPTATAIGVSAIQLAVIIFVAIGIGSITPPMAMTLFVTAKICDVKISDMMKPLMPFLLFGAVPIMIIVTYVPFVSEWLPSLLMK